MTQSEELAKISLNRKINNSYLPRPIAMETKILDPQILSKKFFFIAIIDSPVLAAAAYAFVIERTEIGIGLIALSFAITGALTIKALTRIDCPKCNREMPKRLTEPHFKCKPCQISWRLSKS